MRKQFKDIQKINDQFYNDNKTNILKAISKLGEEYGELVQSINKVTGVKNSKLSTKQIVDECLEEASDVIQNVFSICDLLGISYDELVKSLDLKNDKWRNKK